MEVYIFLGTLIIVLIFALHEEEDRRQFYYIIIALLCFFGLFRGKTVGLDVAKYCDNILHTSFSASTWNHVTKFEDGYNVVIAIYNLIIDVPLLFVGLCNVFFVICWSRYNIKRARSYKIGLLCFYMLGFYIQSFNIIRQYFALSLMLLLFTYINLNKLKVNELIVLIILILFVGTYFHNSIYMLLAIPIYYCIRNTPLNDVRIYSLSLVLTIILFSLGIVKTILGHYGAALYLINEKSNTYYQSALIGHVEEGEYSFYRVLLDNAFLLYLLLKVKQVNIYVFLFVSGQVFINLFAPLNVLFARLPIVLFIVSLPFVVDRWVLNNYKVKIVIFIYLSIIFVNLLIKNYGLTQPYLFFFE